jgi:hypothetical protein
MILPTLSPVTLALLAWAILGPALLGGATWAYGAWVQRPLAVADARHAAQIQCMADIDAIVTETRRDADDKTAAADDAARAVPDTPADAAQLAALCKADAYCRGRQ